MPYYPINLHLTGRKCVVIGGGEVAERKTLALVAAGAAVTVVSPDLTAALAKLVQTGKINYYARRYAPGDVAEKFLAIIATNDAAVNRQAAHEAKANGVLVNVADAPELCDFTIPAAVTRGDLVITVSTGGKSPALARQLREEIELNYGPEYGLYLEIIGRLRKSLQVSQGSSRTRSAFWRQAIDSEVLALLKQGRLQEAEEKIKHAISSFRAQS